MTHNESDNDGSMHRNQGNVSGADGRDCVASTSVRLPWIAHSYVVFALHRGFKIAKHRHHQTTPILQVYSVQIRMNIYSM